MFEFLLMAGTYDSRAVGRDEFDWGFVSTARVNDGRRPFETAVEHTAYNGGRMVIVESYLTEDAAAKGHVRWVATMTADELPDALVDCGNAEISQLICEVDGEDAMRYPRED